MRLKEYIELKRGSVIRRLKECFNRLSKTKPRAGIALRARSRLLRGRQGCVRTYRQRFSPLENFEILAAFRASVLLRPLL
jgi:hypothetical protein